MTPLPPAIRRADPRSAQGRALLGASHAHLASLYPPEDNFHLSADELAAPHVAFWIASDGDRALGCVALARMDGYGEVKSLWVAPEARGRGLGEALMAALESQARAQGLPLLRLETGDTLDAAQGAASAPLPLLLALLRRLAHPLHQRRLVRPLAEGVRGPARRVALRMRPRRGLGLPRRLLAADSHRRLLSVPPPSGAARAGGQA